MAFRLLLLGLVLGFVGCINTNTYSDNFAYTYLNKYEISNPDDTLGLRFSIVENILETKFNKRFKGKEAYKNHVKEVQMRALVILDKTGERFDTLQFFNPTINPMYSDSIIIKKCFFRDVTFDDVPDLVLELLFVSKHRCMCGFDYEDGFVERTKGKILICDLKKNRWVFEHLSELSFEQIPETKALEAQPWSGFPYWRIDCLDSRRFLFFEFDNKYLNSYEYEFKTYNRPFMLTKEEIRQGDFLNKQIFIYNPQKGYLDLERFTKM